MIESIPWTLVLRLAGLGQLILALGSLSIPVVLRWREDLAKLWPLTRQIFWVYACYILGTNVSFGLLSLLAPHWLLDACPLAGAVSGYMTLYWGARLVTQFAVLDRSAAPPGWFFKVAEAALVGLFLALTLVYGSVAWGHWHRALP
jgi:hypothetical protein